MEKRFCMGDNKRSRRKFWPVLCLTVMIFCSTATAAFAQGTEKENAVHSSSGELKAYTITTCTYPKKFEKKREKILKKLENLKGKEFSQCDAYLIEDKKGAKKSLQPSTNAYFGNLKDGRPNGFGVAFSGGILYYAGEWKKGKIDGYGMLFSNGVLKGEGKFKNGRVDGEGIQYYMVDKETIELANRQIAYGISRADQETESEIETEVYIDYPILTPSVKAEGTFKKGRLTGKDEKNYYVNYVVGENSVTCVNQDSNYGVLMYEGEMKRGVYNGEGKLYYSSGILEYKGKFKNDKYDGKGILYKSDGSVNYKGKFKKGSVE